MKIQPIALACLSAALISGASAATVWDEGINGDLSSVAATPTAIILALGDNTVIGSVTSSGDTRDFLTFTVPSGQFLNALILNAYDDPGTGTPNDGNRGFNAINAGSTGLTPGTDPSGSFLGGNHVDPPLIGSDLLVDMGGAGRLVGTGFSGPLGPGTYSYVIQQTGPQVSAYELNFQIVPEPSAALLSLSACALLGIRRRRA